MRRILPFLLLAVFASGLYGCGYNEMQAKEEGVFAAWGDVEAAYQRRTDLVPNLVEIVKGYAKHESETLKAVTEARAKVGSVQVSKEMLAARTNGALPAGTVAARLGPVAPARRLGAVPQPEGEPELHGPAEPLEGTENRINVARVRYNRAVQEFNVSIRTFPNSMTNSLLLHLVRKEPFKADEGAKTAPKVKF